MPSRFAKVFFLAVVSLSVCVSTHAQTLSSETYTIEQSVFGQPYPLVTGVDQNDGAPEEDEPESESRVPTGRRERELLEYFSAVLGGDVSASDAIEYTNTGGSSLWPGILNQAQGGSGQEDSDGVFNEGANNQNLESGYVVEESPVIEAPGFQKNRVALLFMFLMLCVLMTFRIVGLRRF